MFYVVDFLGKDKKQVCDSFTFNDLTLFASNVFKLLCDISVLPSYILITKCQLGKKDEKVAVFTYDWFIDVFKYKR